MTRVLSELLGAAEPMFHHSLSHLEATSGHPNADIRLSTEIERATKHKLRELGLDRNDTTGIELYAALQDRVRQDNERLAATLKQKYGHDANLTTQISKALASLPVPKSCFALKITVAKQLLKKLPPKQVMKALGYRSLESMMKRESPLAVFAAAWVIESASWQKSMLDAYKKLAASDFEIRLMNIVAPDSKRWNSLANAVVVQKKHNIVGLKELGGIVLLPLPKTLPPAVTLTTLLLALHAMNEVRAAGTFLKLSQVKPGFGKLVQIVVVDEPTLSARLLDEPVPWQVIQRYYARFSERFQSELFGPHIQPDDLGWHSIEKALSHIEPSLAFWHHTTHLGLIADHQPVSLNVVDAALNYCNQLPYANRIVHYFRHSLWHELIIRYLKHENVEQTVLGGLEAELAEEQAVA